jgi:hypothetical protein
VVFAAFLLEAAAHLVYAILTRLWLVVPTIALIFIQSAALRSDAQPVALLSLALFRALRLQRSK